MTPHQIVETLKAKRSELQLRQTDVSQKAGHAQHSVHHWESGKFAPTLYSLVNWAEALGYEVELKERK